MSDPQGNSFAIPWAQKWDLLVVHSVYRDITIPLHWYMPFRHNKLSQIFQQLNLSSISWNITPCSSLKVKWHFGGTYHHHLQGLHATCFMLVSCLVYSLTLKIEVTCSFKMSVDSEWTIWRYIPENVNSPEPLLSHSSPRRQNFFHFGS
jgi:hypothetical protein